MLQGSLAPAGDAPHRSARQRPAFPGSARGARAPSPHPAPSPPWGHRHRRGAPRGGQTPSPRQTPQATRVLLPHAALPPLPDTPEAQRERFAPGSLPSGDPAAALGPAPCPAALAAP